MGEYKQVQSAAEVPGSARAATRRMTYSLVTDYDGD